METTTSNHETPKKQMAGDSCCSAGATVQKILEQGAEAIGQAEQRASDAYEETSRKVHETYEKAKSYSNENPGTIILLSLGIGIGIGILLGATTRR